MVASVLRLFIAVVIAFALLASRAAAATAPDCRAPQAAGFSGCLAASAADRAGVRATFDSAAGRTGGGLTSDLHHAEGAGRRADIGLIVGIWAMTILGFGTAAGLLRRNSVATAASQPAG